MIIRHVVAHDLKFPFGFCYGPKVLNLEIYDLDGPINIGVRNNVAIVSIKTVSLKKKYIIMCDRCNVCLRSSKSL